MSDLPYIQQAQEVKITGQSSTGTTVNYVGADSNGNMQVVVAKISLTASSPTFATVGTSSAQVIASNVNRKGLVLTNTSTSVISFGVGATAVLNSGITLVGGGVWAMDEFNFTTGAINAIAHNAGSNLAIQEFTT
jgi:hypothetical protein